MCEGTLTYQTFTFRVSPTSGKYEVLSDNTVNGENTFNSDNKIFPSEKREIKVKNMRKLPHGYSWCDQPLPKDEEVNRYVLSPNGDVRVTNIKMRIDNQSESTFPPMIRVTNQNPIQRLPLFTLFGTNANFTPTSEK